MVLGRPLLNFWLLVAEVEPRLEAMCSGYRIPCAEAA
jgi:hypothetical protein